LQCWISPAEIAALPLGRRSLTVSIPAGTQATFGLNLANFRMPAPAETRAMV
jgi:hypothetical protein